MRPRTINVPGFLVLLSLFAVWQLIAVHAVMSELLFPPITKVLASLYRMVVDGEIFEHATVSLRNMFAGLLFAMVIAIPLGILIGHSRKAKDLLLPSVELLRPIPETALIPLAIALFGIGDIQKIVLVAFGCSRILVVNAMYGARSVDPRLIDVARAYGYSERRLLTRVVVPAASPQIMTGLRYSLIIALILVISAEFLGSDKGIGFYTLFLQRTFETSDMFACVLFLCILGYVLNRAFKWIEMWTMHWSVGVSQRLQ